MSQGPPKRIKVTTTEEESAPLPFTVVQETVSSKPRPDRYIPIDVHPGHKPHQYAQEINHNIQIVERQLRDAQSLEQEKKLVFELEQTTASIQQISTYYSQRLENLPRREYYFKLYQANSPIISAREEYYQELKQLVEDNEQEHKNRIYYLKQQLEKRKAQIEDFRRQIYALDVYTYSRPANTFPVQEKEQLSEDSEPESSTNSKDVHNYL